MVERLRSLSLGVRLLATARAFLSTSLERNSKVVGFNSPRLTARLRSLARRLSSGMSWSGGAFGVAVGLAATVAALVAPDVREEHPAAKCGSEAGRAGERSSGDAASVQTFEIPPGQGIGPVQLGHRRAEARAAMEATGQLVDEFVRWPGAPPVLAMCENAFQVYFDESGRVAEIEVMGPARDAQERREQPSFAAVYSGVDVFRTPAEEVAALVSRSGPPDDTDEDHGPSLSFPTLGLRLWRDDDPTAPPKEWAPFFMTALVSRAQPPA